jgi:o-succinylbenzoate synthase
MAWRFAFKSYRLAFREPVRTGRGSWPEREGVLIRLEDEGGRVGFGEAAVLPWFGTETAGEAAAWCRAAGGSIGADLIASVPGSLPCLASALSAAASPLPVGKERPHLAVAALLPAGRACLAAAPARVEAGFRTFKWKIGAGDVADELGIFEDLCALLPGGARVRLDANGSLDRRRSERWLERSADHPVEFLEQPSDPADADLLLGLAADYPTPIALDESLVTGGDAARWLEAGWSGVFVVKPSLLGDARAVLSRLEAAKARVVFSSALETRVGARHALAAAFAWTGGSAAIGFGVWPLFADGRFDGPSLAPFIRPADVEALDPQAAWNALS